jgi:transposase
MGTRRAWGLCQHQDHVETTAPARFDAQKKTLVAAERLRADVADARERWEAFKFKLDPRRLVFLDETWTTTNMTRLRGRAPRGQRLVGRVPWGHWKTTTFLAGLRHDRLVAPLVLDGAINGAVFRAYIEQFLAPTLGPNDIVLADNLASHKVAGVREAITARGAELIFLPAYSPDQNPIEQAFAKLKALLRKTAPRSRQALWQSIGSIVSTFARNECANYLQNCGYIQSG